MSRVATDVWEAEAGMQLAQVLAAIDDPEMMQQLLHDLLTRREIIDISARLEAATMLQAGATYAEVMAKTKLSSRTIARVSDWVQNGTGGFSVAIDIVQAYESSKPSGNRRR